MTISIHTFRITRKALSAGLGPFEVPRLRPASAACEAPSSGMSAAVLGRGSLPRRLFSGVGGRTCSRTWRRLRGDCDSSEGPSGTSEDTQRRGREEEHSGLGPLGKCPGLRRRRRREEDPRGHRGLSKCPGCSPASTPSGGGDGL